MRGLGPGNREFFGPCEMALSRFGAQKTREKTRVPSPALGEQVKELNRPARAAQVHKGT